MKALAVIAVVAVVGFIVYTMKRNGSGASGGGSLLNGGGAARERAERERLEREQAAARKREQETRKAEILELIKERTEAYEREYYRYALRDRSYALGLELEAREELKKLHDARDSCPAFEVVSICRDKGFAPTLILDSMNEYLEKEWKTTADDRRIPAATVERLLQERARAEAEKKIRAFMEEKGRM